MYGGNCVQCKEKFRKNGTTNANCVESGCADGKFWNYTSKACSDCAAGCSKCEEADKCGTCTVASAKCQGGNR